MPYDYSKASRSLLIVANAFVMVASVDRFKRLRPIARGKKLYTLQIGNITSEAVSDIRSKLKRFTPFVAVQYAPNSRTSYSQPPSRMFVAIRLVPYARQAQCIISHVRLRQLHDQEENHRAFFRLRSRIWGTSAWKLASSSRVAISRSELHELFDPTTNFRIVKLKLGNHLMVRFFGKGCSREVGWMKMDRKKRCQGNHLTYLKPLSA